MAASVISRKTSLIEFQPAPINRRAEQCWTCPRFTHKGFRHRPSLIRALELDASPPSLDAYRKRV